MRTLAALASIGLWACTTRPPRDAGADAGSPADVRVDEPRDVGEVLDAADAIADTAHGDISHDGDVTDDVFVAPAPWSSGSITFPHESYRPLETFVLPDCGAGCRRIANLAAVRSAVNFCAHGEYVYFGSTDAWRLHVPSGNVGLITHFASSRISAPGLGCSPGRAVVSLMNFAGAVMQTAIVLLDDTTLVGRRIWSYESPNEFDLPPTDPNASDTLLAFDAQITGHGLSVWTQTPLGGAAQFLAMTWPAPIPVVSGNSMVFALGTDVWTWSVGDAAPRNLTSSSAADDWDGWIDGSHVTFSSTRNGGGDRSAPVNSDVYLLDLIDNSLQQITTDTANQNSASISGDWIVWVDSRNATLRTGDDGFPPGGEVWGYHLPTRREMRIAWTRHTDPANARLFFPRVLNGRVYYASLENVMDPTTGRVLERSFIYEQMLPAL